MPTVIPMFRSGPVRDAKIKSNARGRWQLSDPATESLEWWKQLLLENLDAFAQVLQEGQVLVVEGVRPTNEEAENAQRDLTILGVDPELIRAAVGKFLT